MADRLGFDKGLKIVLLAGVGLLALAIILGNIATVSDDGDTEDDLRVSAEIFAGLGTLAGATAILLAAVKADGSHPGVRAAMMVIAALLLFGGLVLNVGTAFGGGLFN